MCKLLKQLGSSAFLDRRSTMDDHILTQAGRLNPGSLEGNRHARIPPNVLKLSLAWIQMRREQFIPVDRDPHARHLRGAVRGARDEMAERS